MGLSQGGMIYQWLAIAYPGIVKKLAIVISLSRQSKTIQQVIAGWLKMAREECYNELAIDMMVNSFTERYLKRIRLFQWLIKRIIKLQSKQRFLIQDESCRLHDAYNCQYGYAAGVCQLQSWALITTSFAEDIIKTIKESVE